MPMHDLSDQKPSTTEGKTKIRKPRLTPEMFGGLTPEEFEREMRDYTGRKLQTAEGLKRERIKWLTQLKSPVDKPSWGPDWIHRRGDALTSEKEPQHPHGRGFFSKPTPANADEKPDQAKIAAMAAKVELSEDERIARDMERSRQVSCYRPLYLGSAALALVVMLAAMIVDYHIIREVWMRALSNEFMVVPAALQTSVIFKSLQVVFAVLIVHFMLKIIGPVGRGLMIGFAFVLAMGMIGGLGYLVAHDSLHGGTATAQTQDNPYDATTLDPAFMPKTDASAQPGKSAKAQKEYSLPIPKLSEKSLNDVSSWFWFAFAGVVFYIVTTVAALFMRIAENNIRNFHIGYDYRTRRRAFARLHMLDKAQASNT